MRLLMAVILLIAAALVAGAYFDFNPVIPIFLILGFGVYRVSRWDAPSLPEGTHVWGDTYGIHLSGRDFIPRDTDSHSGGNFRDGVDPNDPSNAR